MREDAADRIKFLTGFIALNGGELAGKTKLQKAVYLIQRKIETNIFSFEYHHYGPFSIDLADSADRAILAGSISGAPRLGYYSIPYVMYSTNAPKPKKLAGVPANAISQWLKIINKYDAIVTELAATRIYLRDEEGVEDHQIDDLLRFLKPQKANPTRLKEAKKLLAELDL